MNTHAARGAVFALGIETPEKAARREFEEETRGQCGPAVALTAVGVFDDPARDPRNTAEAWVVSHAFVACLSAPMALQAGDDARQAEWVLVDALLAGQPGLAFDHPTMLRRALDQMGLRPQPFKNGPEADETAAGGPIAEEQADGAPGLSVPTAREGGLRPSGASLPALRR